ncbi:hypothetical protein HHI36_001077 [Cryptolaemus montrouzieri]|uniref:Retrovirus-related Pol polyprotein from transposon TNT 1-94 n=1 Tax=Cryptolaemus montrouzieri TaxID=559131 RepID=A0ABD2P6M1_9CUCU
MGHLNRKGLNLLKNGLADGVNFREVCRNPCVTCLQEISTQNIKPENLENINFETENDENQNLENKNLENEFRDEDLRGFDEIEQEPVLTGNGYPLRERKPLKNNDYEYDRFSFLIVGENHSLIIMNEQEPQSIEDVLNHEDKDMWKHAMIEEMKSLSDNKT